jgi:hypothetical protein
MAPYECTDGTMSVEECHKYGCYQTCFPSATNETNDETTATEVDDSVWGEPFVCYMACGTNDDGSHVCGDVWSHLECNDVTPHECWQDCGKSVGRLMEENITPTEDKSGGDEGGEGGEPLAGDEPLAGGA